MNHCKDNNINPIIVINMNTGTTQEASEWVQYVKDNNFKVKGWELGNELYMTRYWALNLRSDIVKMTEAYIAKAKLFVSAMKAVDPSIKIGVTAAPVDIPAIHPDHDTWNKVLGRAKYTFYDFYATHIYTGAPAQFDDN